MIDVCVVGGGPAGLALARSLAARTRLKVEVFERVTNMQRRLGAGVNILPNGLAALRTIDPELAANVVGTTVKRNQVAIEDAQGNVLSLETVVFGEDKPEDQVMEALVPWHAMRRVLAESVDDGVLHYGKRFQGLEIMGVDSSGSGQEGTGDGAAAATGAMVKFEDGSSCAARVVVGADGMLSPVREAWINDGSPNFDGRVVFRGQARTEDIKKLPGWETLDSRICATGKGFTCTIYSLWGGATVWSIGVDYHVCQECSVEYSPYTKAFSSARTSLMEAEDSGPWCYKQVNKFKNRLPLWVNQVLEASDPATTTVHGDYTRPPSSYQTTSLGAGPVTLVGDAMHPFKAAGVGANVAFEDAAVLSYYLAKMGPCEAALRAYEADRLPRLHLISSHIDHVMSTIGKLTGPAYVEFKKQQAEYERTTIHIFDHPCTKASHLV